jgi:phosphoglycolate phosphatase
MIADTLGRPHVTHERVMRDIALPLPQLFEAFIGEYRPEWRELYIKNTAIVEPKLMRPFPDTIPALKRLREDGVTLAVASNREDPRPGMERLGLAQYFDAMAGGMGLSAAGVRGEPLPYKPDPAMLNVLLKHFGLPPEQAAYVGDAKIDIETAKAANMRGIGVTHGNVTEDGFRELGAWRVIDALTELPDIVAEEES